MPIATATRPLAVVTGASSGIGFELARQFAEHGFDLVVAAEDGGIVEAAQALRQGGADAEPVRVDLATPDGVETLVARVAGLGRPVAALALNAGVGAGGDFARETALEDDLRVIALNVSSAVHLARRLLPAMAARGEGRVLFTSSIAATMPAPLNAVYGASKAFVQSFAEALRQELRDTGVTVTALMPGPTDTDFFRRAGMEGTRVDEGTKDDPADVAREGFEALMAGKDHVVAGSLRNSLQAGAAKVLPQAATARLHERLNAPAKGERE